jgi:hypothetical protein
MSQGKPAADGMLALAGELREFEMPRPIFTQSEKIDWAPRVYTTHHAELQVQTDLTKVIKSPGQRQQLEAARQLRTLPRIPRRFELRLLRAARRPNSPQQSLSSFARMTSPKSP